MREELESRRRHRDGAAAMRPRGNDGDRANRHALETVRIQWIDDGTWGGSEPTESVPFRGGVNRGAAESRSTMITARQRALVRSSWDLMRPTAVHVADLFYDRLVELDPSLEELFPEDPHTQRPRFMKAVAASLNALDDLEAMRPFLNELGRHQATDGVRDGHYVTIGKALLWTFEQSLAEHFTPPVKDAWAALYGQLSSAMIQGAHDPQPTTVAAVSVAAAAAPVPAPPVTQVTQVPPSGPQVTPAARDVAKSRGQRQLAAG
jgi:hemoglobin-like flavoprotein